MTRAAIVALVLAVLACCQPPDPGRPCGWPVDYMNGWWVDDTGTQVAHTATEDSIPDRWACTPDAAIVKWFAGADN